MTEKLNNLGFLGSVVLTLPVTRFLCSDGQQVETALLNESVVTLSKWAVLNTRLPAVDQIQGQ